MSVNPSMLRVDTSNYDRYTRPTPPKVGFFKKLGRTLGKVVGFAAPIGAAVTAIALPGVGLPIAAGLYGLGNFSQDQVARSQAKDQAAMANQPANPPVVMPGFFQDSLDAGQAATSFMAPKSMEADIGNVIMHRESMHQEAIQSL
jgi:hypothetical protein